MLDKARLELLGKALALAAFLFTVFTYANNLRLDQKKDRYDEIRSLIGRYEADGIREAEQDLSTRLLYYRVDGLDPNDPGDYSDKLFEEIAKETLFGAVGTDASGASAFLPRLLDIADFYAEVSFCIDAAICDARIGERYFCPRATAFSTAYSRFIAYYGEYSGSMDWTNGLDALVARCGA